MSFQKMLNPIMPKEPKMDIEFHYYQTYLIAVKAGFTPADAYTLAYASQYVDDNDIVFEISKDTAHYYRNYISQTMNILKPIPKLLRIYPVFHFIPGDYDDFHANRKDGRMHRLNTTPNNSNAHAIFDDALATGNLYRIGVATHAFVDTWAHQNFVGYFDDFNAMKGMLEKALPNIGHADAKHSPDWPGLIWEDVRLVSAHQRVDNRERFLEAAEQLFHRLSSLARPGADASLIAAGAQELRDDLFEVMRDRDPNDKLKEVRMKKCQELAATRPEYGQTDLPDYSVDTWFDEVVNEKVHGLRDRNESNHFGIKVFADEYTWKDVSSYKNSEWYRFQEAVKTHQEVAIAILDEHVFKHMELEGF